MKAPFSVPFDGPLTIPLLVKAERIGPNEERFTFTPLRPVPVKAPGRSMIAWNQRVAIWKARNG